MKVVARDLGWLWSLLLGALSVLSFAPYNAWPLWFAIIPTLLALLEQAKDSKGRFVCLYLFAFAMWGLGAGWLNHSFYTFGNMPYLISIAATTLFCAFMALLWTVPFIPWIKWGQGSLAASLIMFPTLWVIGEWSRDWIFTGFPWLFAAYGTIDSFLAGYAPLGGTLLVSFILIGFSTLVFAALKLRSQTFAWVSISLGFIVAVMGWQLSYVPWTQPIGDAKEISIVQPNTNQSDKWDPQNRADIINTLTSLSFDRNGADIVFWPEAAIPLLARRDDLNIKALDDHATARNLNLLVGVPTIEFTAGRYHMHNSIVGLGNASGRYHKQKLVPFTEYIPFIDIVGPLLQVFNLPVGSQTPGDANQPPVVIDGIPVLPAVCYEIAYGALIAESARNVNILSNHSNDSWFGDTLGPIQHFEITRWRAVESARPLVRVTNNGISAFIDEKGRVLSRADRFASLVLTDRVQPRTGLTPFQKYLNAPLITLLFFLLGITLIISIRKAQSAS